MLIALALSLFVHGLLLFIQRIQPIDNAARRQELAGNAPLAVTLAPAATSLGPAVAPRPETAPQPHRAAPRPAPLPPPVITTPRPSASVVAPNPPPVQAPAQAPAPAPPTDTPAAPPMDMMAQLNAIRQRRREAANPAPSDAPQTEDQRALGNAMRNLRSLTPGQQEDSTSGIFAMTRVGYNSAEFTFRGWNTNFRRNWNETITVERGSNPDIQLAVVRKMIEIIRRYESRDFVWESHRLGRNVTLSARPEDTAGLEDFLLKEFFPDYRG